MLSLLTGVSEQVVEFVFVRVQLPEWPFDWRQGMRGTLYSVFFPAKR